MWGDAGERELYDTTLNFSVISVEANGRDNKETFLEEVTFN